MAKKKEEIPIVFSIDESKLYDLLLDLARERLSNDKFEEILSGAVASGIENGIVKLGRNIREEQRAFEPVYKRVDTLVFFDAHGANVEQPNRNKFLTYICSLREEGVETPEIKNSIFTRRGLAYPTEGIEESEVIEKVGLGGGWAQIKNQRFLLYDGCSSITVEKLKELNGLGGSVLKEVLVSTNIMNHEGNLSVNYLLKADSKNLSSPSSFKDLDYYDLVLNLTYV